MSMGALKLKLRVRNNIGDLLEAEGRSKTWLAKSISVGLKKPISPQMVVDWCSNRSQPSIAYIMRIQKVTGWTIDQMFEEVNEDE